MRLTGLSDITARTARAAAGTASEKVTSPARSAPAHSGPGVGVATVLGSGDAAPTFDTERVAEIRKAIEEDRYPLVPARIADALIAAKLYGIVEA